MAEACAPGAVVTDHDLGDDEGRDGIWLLEQARQRCPDARRILMSGGKATIDEHVASGLVVRFLSKPVGTEDIRAVLQMKACIKCGVEITEPHLQGDELCARCGDAP